MQNITTNNNKSKAQTIYEKLTALRADLTDDLCNKSINQLLRMYECNRLEERPYSLSVREAYFNRCPETKQEDFIDLGRGVALIRASNYHTPTAYTFVIIESKQNRYHISNRTMFRQSINVERDMNMASFREVLMYRRGMPMKRQRISNKLERHDSRKAIRQLYFWCLTNPKHIWPNWLHLVMPNLYKRLLTETK
jgi:hypothetical protein